MPEPRTGRARAWWTSDVETASGAVESRQWIGLGGMAVTPDEDGARELGRRYLAEISSTTHGLVRSRRTAGGVVLVLAGAVPLLRFGPPELRVASDRVECRFRIEGGLLTARAGGALVIAQSSSASPELELAVAGYFPRLGGTRRGRALRRAVYSRVQARAHRAISRRFLERAALECRS